jgi:hypothetical protein
MLLVSPKAKRELAREHCESARLDIDEGREKDALSALLYAAEAAIVALADRHEVETRKHHGRKADDASDLYERGLLSDDFGRCCVISTGPARTSGTKATSRTWTRLWGKSLTVSNYL